MTDLSSALDARTTLARPDLAALALEGRVRATSFRATEAMVCAAPVADIQAEASPLSERIDQLIHGEIFDVLERRGDRVWGQARRDGMVGWMEIGALRTGVRPPTHSVRVANGSLPLNALVRSGEASSEDLAPIGAFDTDPVAVAERLLGVPHALGARSSRATDCSGMVQQALYACGRPGPRHAHAQARLGEAVGHGAARRGDLVVWLAPDNTNSWTGHSGLMMDADRVIHATGHHGQVTVEAFADANARCLADGFAPAQFRRLA